MKTQKEISLSRFFLLFLTHALLSLAGMVLLWALLLYAASAFHIILPANYVERSLSVWCDTLDGHRAITPEEIPAGADYAFFDKKGTLLRTNLEERVLKDAVELASESGPGNIRRNGACILLRLSTDTQCVIIAYRLVALFTSPFLRRIFPNAEIFFLALLLLLFIVDIILISVCYARKLKRELQKLAAAAARIGQQTLAFEVPGTKLLEFNHIMDSLEHLKTDLQRSLEEQWAMEQQKKRQLTELAHDIKTPLAIVTGNAELLLETEQTEEQKEYSEFILEHAGQIQRYVTGMMELARPHTVSEGVCDISALLSAMAGNIESLGKKKRLSCLLFTGNLPDTLPVPEDGLRLSVRDEGAGFSGEALSLAATLFYRSDHSRGSKEHFGLGLAIAKQIVTELGGTLHLENAPEGGALVTVWLPSFSGN